MTDTVEGLGRRELIAMLAAATALGACERLDTDLLGGSLGAMTKATEIDPVEFARALIACPSVTGTDAGALGVLQDQLEALGFICKRYPFGEGDARVDNLYARLGTQAPNFCFAGHTDVVPAGEGGKWTAEPFAGEVKDGQLWGRGAADMKGAIAAFVGAVSGLFDQGWRTQRLHQFFDNRRRRRSLRKTVRRNYYRR